MTCLAILAASPRGGEPPTPADADGGAVASQRERFAGGAGGIGVGHGSAAIHHEIAILEIGGGVWIQRQKRRSSSAAQDYGARLPSVARLIVEAEIMQSNDRGYAELRSF